MSYRRPPDNVLADDEDIRKMSVCGLRDCGQMVNGKWVPTPATVKYGMSACCASHQRALHKKVRGAGVMFVSLDGTILMGINKNGELDIPGGRWSEEDDGSSQKTAAREAAEEVGIHVEIDKFEQCLETSPVHVETYTRYREGDPNPVYTSYFMIYIVLVTEMPLDIINKSLDARGWMKSQGKLPKVMHEHTKFISVDPRHIVYSPDGKSATYEEYRIRARDVWPMLSPLTQAKRESLLKRPELAIDRRDIFLGSVIFDYEGEVKQAKKEDQPGSAFIVGYSSPPPSPLMLTAPVETKSQPPSGLRRVLEHIQNTLIRPSGGVISRTADATRRSLSVVRGKCPREQV